MTLTVLELLGILALVLGTAKFLASRLDAIKVDNAAAHAAITENVKENRRQIASLTEDVREIRGQMGQMALAEDVREIREQMGQMALAGTYRIQQCIGLESLTHSAPDIRHGGARKILPALRQGRGQRSGEIQMLNLIEKKLHAWAVLCRERESPGNRCLTSRW